MFQEDDLTQDATDLITHMLFIFLGLAIIVSAAAVSGLLLFTRAYSRMALEADSKTSGVNVDSSLKTVITTLRNLKNSTMDSTFAKTLENAIEKLTETEKCLYTPIYY